GRRRPAVGRQGRGRRRAARPQRDGPDPPGQRPAGPARAGVEVRVCGRLRPRGLAPPDLEGPPGAARPGRRRGRAGAARQLEGPRIRVDEVELLLDVFPIRHEDGKWSTASAGDESGWRPLMWSDLTKDRLAGIDVPAIPGDWDPRAKAAAALAGGLLKGNPLG